MRAQEVSSPESLLAAAQTAASVQLRYAQRGMSLATAALAGARTLEPLRHYPLNDVVDAEAGTRFYYHAHTSSRYPAAEHGHFHLFVHDPAADGPGFFHLAGLSLDACGQPLRFFATNRWVTGEHWSPGERVAAALPGFRLRTHGRLAPLADWLTAMVQLFADDIAALLRERDAAIAPHIHTAGLDAALEDRRLDVLSERSISAPERLRALSVQFQE